jgi:hypothetical protein
MLRDVSGNKVDIFSENRKIICGGTMKKSKAVKELKIEHPRRAVITEKEALKRMKEFPKRKEKFIATVRTGKS